MIKIQVKSDFAGPTLLELEPVLPEIKGEVELRWANSKAEIRALERHPDRQFLLYVPDLNVMERTVTALGQPIQIDPKTLDSGKAALISRKNQSWRQFTKEVGQAVSGCIVTKLSAEAIRKGNKPRLAAIATDCLHEGIDPVDADVLLRIRAIRGN